MRKAKWQLVMQNEFDFLMNNQTWKLTSLSRNRKVLEDKWIYKLKREINDDVIRHKARWVIRNFEQRENIDFNEIFALIVKSMSYKAVFAMIVVLNWKLKQMNVKIIFLYDDINEEIFIEQFTDFAKEDDEFLVCKFRKTLYDLKQFSRVWYDILFKFLKFLNFNLIIFNYSVFINERIIIEMYVNDILLFDLSKSKIQRVKDRLSQKFRMIDLESIHHYLSMKVIRDRLNRTLRLSQFNYIEQMLKNHQFNDIKLSDISMKIINSQIKENEKYIASSHLRQKYQSAVNSFMYVMLNIRSDIVFVVSIINRYEFNLTEANWTTIKRIFRYLRETVNYELVYQENLKSLTDYMNSDWADDRDIKRFTADYVFNIESAVIS